MYNSWNDLITTNFTLGTQSSNGWYRIKCPVCGDKTPNAGFTFSETGFGYNCFRGSCNTKIRHDHDSDPNISIHAMTKLFQAVGIADDTWTHLLYSFDKVNISLQPKLVELINPPTIELPYGSTHLLNSNPKHSASINALDYLMNRSVDPLQPFYITTAIPPKKQLDFRNRIIIPYYYKNELVFYQGAWTHPTWKTSLKYLNTNLGNRTSIFYNMNELDKDIDSPVFVVEGVFDAMWFPNAVATLSNVLTEQQILRLEQCKRKIIIIPDMDFAGTKIVELAIKKEWDVSFPSWNGICKDIDEAVRRYGKLYVIKEIMSSLKSSVFEKELVAEFLRATK